MIARRLSPLYDRGFRSYVYWKVRMDPVYPAVLDVLRGHDDRPLLDLGCGLGILAFFLREHGFTSTILGVDHDEGKIDAARRAATRYRGVDFIRANAADALPADHNVVLIDLLQYVGSEAQETILRNAAAVVPPAGVAILRQGIRDHSWRYRVSHSVDAIGRAIRWNRGTPMNFPTAETVLGAFAGFEAQVVPLWGRTPYNNYLFVFTRPAAVRRPG